MEELDKASGAIVSLKTAKGVLQEHLLVTKKEMRSSEGRSNRPNDGHEVRASLRVFNQIFVDIFCLRRCG